MKRSERIVLLVLIGLVIVTGLYFVEFWLFSEAKREPVFFGLLTAAVLWGVSRNLWGALLYYFISPPPEHRAKRAYTVDVLTTAMPGEPYEMFESTLAAIAALEHPHESFLLDGGNDPRLVRLCESLGVTHVNCAGVRGAKAGKINFALENHSSAEIVFIVDPDHRPRPDLFARTLGFFDDPKVGFVQVVQAYHNRNETFIAQGAAEQTFGFYGPFLLALNGLGIPTAIGANCIFRRSALDSIGGHAVHLAEDALTSMRLHAHGWRSVYVPYRGSEGLVPTDLRSFLQQQLKWAAGMSALIVREYPKLFSSLSLVCRVHYLFAGTHYFHAFASLLTFALPVFFLFSGTFAVEFTLTDFAIHLLPYALSLLLLHAFAQRWYTDPSEKRFPWRSLVLEKATWHVYLIGLFSGLFGRRVPYLPTQKARVNVEIPVRLLVPQFVVIALSACAIAFALATYSRREEGTWLMIGFALLNVLLTSPLCLLCFRSLLRNASFKQKPALGRAPLPEEVHGPF